MAGNRRVFNTDQKIELVRTGLAGFVRRNWRVLVGIACVLLVSGSLMKASSMLSATPHFTLATAEIVGFDRFDPAQVAEICGLVPGVTNTFDVDTSAVRESCLEDPRIEHADVLKFLPDRIRVTIREARPVLLVRTHNDLVPFDWAGRPLYAVPSDWVAGLPVLTGLEDLMVPIVIPVPAGESLDEETKRLDAQEEQDARRTARVESLVLKALELYATMEVTDPAWLEGGATITWNAASGYEMDMPGRPRLVFGRDGFMDKASRVNISLSSVALLNKDIETVFLNNDLEPGTVLLRERTIPDVTNTETAITRKVDFE